MKTKVSFTVITEDLDDEASSALVELIANTIYMINGVDDVDYDLGEEYEDW
jgi:hypothetical protein